MRKLQLSTERGETAASLFRKSIGAEHPRLRERLLALALIAEGFPATAVARRLGRHRSTVEQWVHQYNEHGLEGLTPQFRGQPGTRLTPTELAEVKQTVARSPRQAGLPTGTWSAQQVAALVKRHFQKTISAETARRYLHDLGFRRKRPRKRYLKADPAAQQRFAQELQQLEQHRCHRSVTVYMDQGQIWPDALPRLGWFLRGHPAWVDSTSPRKSDKLRFYVAVIRPLGKVVTMLCPWFDQAQTAQFLEKIRRRLWGYRIDLVYDGAPYHKGSRVRQALKHYRMHAHRLPAYSPQMNAAEPWIGWVKEVLSANTCWQDRRSLVHSFTGFVASLARRTHEVLRRCVPDMFGFNCV